MKAACGRARMNPLKRNKQPVPALSAVAPPVAV
jgi:hypothetical protein